MARHVIQAPNRVIQFDQGSVYDAGCRYMPAGKRQMRLHDGKGRKHLVRRISGKPLDRTHRALEAAQQGIERYCRREGLPWNIVQVQGLER